MQEILRCRGMERQREREREKRERERDTGPALTCPMGRQRNSSGGPGTRQQVPCVGIVPRLMSLWSYVHPILYSIMQSTLRRQDTVRCDTIPYKQYDKIRHDTTRSDIDIIYMCVHWVGRYKYLVNSCSRKVCSIVQGGQSLSQSQNMSG